MYSQNNTRAIIIVDYNLSRRDDVRNISQYAKDVHELDTVLIRHNPVAIDFEISDIVIDLNPLQTDFSCLAKAALEKLEFDYVGGLVFSDDAVKTGAELLEKLNLKVDSALLASNAFCKFAYRTSEQALREFLQPQGIFVPNFATVTSADDLFDFIKNNNGGIVIKPMQEGNNRGVLLLEKPNNSDIEDALEEVAEYIENGVIVEQLITFKDEYSYDGIGDVSFITEKFSASGKYPVECGQLVPADVSERRAANIIKAGNVANLISGQKNGPFHNEIRISPFDDQVAVIEANRRPAGMKIWTLACKVFGEDLYHRWVDSVITSEKKCNRFIAHGSAMNIMLPSHRTLSEEEFCLPVEQYLRLLKQQLIARYQTFFADTEWLEVNVLTKEGGSVYSPARDNTDFLAQILLYHKGSACDLKKMFSVIQKAWLNLLMSSEIQIKIAMN